MPLRQADGTFPPSLYGWAADVHSRVSGALEDVEGTQLTCWGWVYTTVHNITDLLWAMQMSMTQDPRRRLRRPLMLQHHLAVAAELHINLQLSTSKRLQYYKSC